MQKGAGSEPAQGRGATKRMAQAPFTLILDDESTGLGELALRLLRMGIDVFYANDPDEAVLFCGQKEARLIRAVMFPEALDTSFLARVVPRLPSDPNEPGPSLVAVGALEDEERRAELRKTGANRALRLPCDDGTLRWMANEARFEHDHHPKRQFHRAPTSLLARASWGLKRKDLVCSTLSAGGAFLETPSPLETGTRVKLKLPLPSGTIQLKAVVANQASGPPDMRGVGMGVTFLEPGAAERDALRAFVVERTTEFVL